MSQRKIYGILFLLSPVIAIFFCSLIQMLLFRISGDIQGGLLVGFTTISSVFLGIPTGIYLLVTKGPIPKVGNSETVNKTQ